MWCRALPCGVRCCTYSFVHASIIRSIKPRTGTINILHQVCTYYVVESQTMHPQLRSVRLYIAQERNTAQRSPVPCGVGPCPAFCGAVSCGAVLSFEHTAVVVPGTWYDTGTRYRYVRVVYSSFCFLQLIVRSRFPCPPPCKLHMYWRSERDINKHTAHRRQLALHKHLLALSIRYSGQNSWASSFCSLHMFQLHPSLGESSG